jgi:predicted DNA-binding antitoxin AbrB/MazE fold protein
MIRQLEAVYERGMLRPLQPLSLLENQLVRLTLEERSSEATGSVAVFPVSNSPVNNRAHELEWLATESSPYAGQWVALDGNRLVAHGDELAVVSAAARAAGVDRPLLTHVAPTGELPFGGW